MAEAEGIPPTASVASVGPGIRYVERHAYALSGPFEAKTTLQTLLDFTSGSGFIVGTLTMSAPIHMTTAGISSGYIRGFQLDFNSETVGLFKVESGSEDMPTMEETALLIPPFTNVLLRCVDNGASSNFLGTVTFTGRVYGVG